MSFAGLCCVHGWLSGTLNPSDLQLSAIRGGISDVKVQESGEGSDDELFELNCFSVWEWSAFSWGVMGVLKLESGTWNWKL